MQSALKFPCLTFKLKKQCASIKLMTTHAMIPVTQYYFKTYMIPVTNQISCLKQTPNLKKKSYQLNKIIPNTTSISTRT